MQIIKLGQNIVRLRKEKGITQEELANFTGVTKAAVSKWENASTMPDIQILPILATFFDVTVDELLGYESQLTADQIRYYYHKLAADFGEKPFEEVMASCQELIKKYYCCYPFLLNMIVLWLNHAMMADSKERMVEVLDEAGNLCERILENCSDPRICDNVKSIKALVDYQAGRPGKVIETLEQDFMDVNRISSAENLLPMAYLMTGELERAFKACQIGGYRSLTDLIGYQMYLLMSCSQNREYCQEILLRTDGIMELFQVDRLNPNTAAGYYYQSALMLCAYLPDEEVEIAVFERLEKNVQAIKRLFADGVKLHGDEYFTCLDEWFEGMELGTYAVRDPKVVLESALDSFDHPVLVERLTDQKRLKRLKKEVQKIVLP